MTFDAFVGRLANVKRSANGVEARCPSHEDKLNSLSVHPGRDGVTLTCHAGCTAAKICAALGIDLKDLFYESRNGHANGNGARPHTTGAAALTLKDFADAKGLPIDFLSSHGVHEDRGKLVFTYSLMSGQKAPRQRIRQNGEPKFLWNKSDGHPVPYGLWRIPEWRKAGTQDLYLVEGESDALTLWSHGLAALGIPGATLSSTLQEPHVRGFRRVFIVHENDAGGEVFENGTIAHLARLEHRGQVRVIEMALLEQKDPNDLHRKHLDDAGAFESYWAMLVEASRPIELPILGLEIFDDRDVVAKPVEWLWRHRIPLGKLTLFVGHPGLGKSFVTLDVVARLGSGKAWPDGEPNNAQAISLIFSAEDGMEDTIKARLVALGHKPGMARITKRVRDQNDSGEIVRRSFSLARDFPMLERILDREPGIKLVIVDPVSSYLGRVDSHKNAELRSDILDPLAELAERRNIAVLAVSHFNKGSGSNSLERVSGSIAFPAAARAVWGFTDDPENPAGRLMLFGKSNVGPRVDGLAFTILEDQQGRATIDWKGGVDRKLDDVLREQQEQSRDAGGRKLEIAKDLWREMLANGPRLASEVEDRARELGIAESTLKRARWELGVKSEKAGYQGRWKVSLPAVQ